MKKFFTFLCIIISFNFIIVGCNKTTNSKEKEVSKNNILSEKHDQKIKEITHKTGDILIKYPQIELENKDKSEKINNLIKKDISNIEKYYTSESKDITLEINYEIKQLNNNILSIVYKGYYENPNNSYPSQFLCTTNIDLDKEVSIRLKDCEDIDIITKILLSDDKYILKTKDENLAKVQKDYLKHMNEQDLKEMLKNADFSYNNGKFVYPEAFSYKEENSVTIVIPIQHALGDYMELTIK